MTLEPSLRPPPLRVLVKGDSSAVHVAPPGSPRSDMAFSRWLEVLLPCDSRGVVVMNTGREGQSIHDAVCRWTVDEHIWSPDVVVLKLGQYDCLHAFLPARLERHVHNRHEHPGRQRERYRNYVLRPFWRVLARTQRRLDRPGRRGFNRRYRHAARELLFLVDRIREVGAPLVLVVGCGAPGPFWRDWFPGAERRMAEFNTLVRNRIEEKEDPEIRFIPLSEALGEIDPGDTALFPDGIHFSGDAHRRVALSITEHVRAWLAASNSAATDQAP